MLFPSKIDSWLLGVILIALVICALAVVPVVRQPFSYFKLSVILLSVVPGLLLPIWVLLSTNYRIDNGICMIRSGPFHWEVPLSSIESVTPTRNAISSPALSLDRLDIRYAGGKSILVSPRDQDAFIAALQPLL